MAMPESLWLLVVGDFNIHAKATDSGMALEFMSCFRTMGNILENYNLSCILTTGLRYINILGGLGRGGRKELDSSFSFLLL